MDESRPPVGRYGRQKRKVQESINYPGPMNKTGKLVKMYEEKAKGLNKFYTSVLTHSHTSRVNGLQDRDWGTKVSPTVIEDRVSNHLRNLNILHGT